MKRHYELFEMEIILYQEMDVIRTSKLGDDSDDWGYDIWD